MTVGTVFVSYRRRGTHTLAAAGLAERLGQRFGRERVFIDTGLAPGERYPDELKARLAASDVVLAVIDDRWVADFAVERRTDWVRLELSTALRDGKTVIPVLLEGTPQPEYGQVPPDVAEVTLLESAPLRSDHYESDLDALAAAIARTAAAPDVPLATADPAGDRPARPGPRWALRVAAWALVFGVLSLRLADDQDRQGWQVLITAAVVLLMPMACLTLFVLLVALVGPRLDAVTQRHQERSLVTNVKDTWPVFALYLLVLGVIWAGIPLYDATWLSTGAKVLVTGIVVIAVGRVFQVQVRQVARLDTVWPPTVTPDSLSFRRAATRLHALLTDGTARDFARQRQAESVLHALAEVRAELADRGRVRARQWLSGAQSGDPLPAALCGALAGFTVLDCAGVVLRLSEGAAVRLVLVAAAILGVAVVLAAVGLAVSLRVHRRRDRLRADELREWDEKLRPLVFPAHTGDDGRFPAGPPRRSYSE
jgi:hypothetical protein